jgi:hypothetical protein
VQHAVLLVELDRPPRRLGQLQRLIEMQRQCAVDVPLAGAMNGPAGLVVAIDRILRRKAVLSEVGFGAG